MRFFQYSTSSLFLVSPILFSCGNAVDNQRKTDKPEVKIITVTDENKQKTINQTIKELTEKIVLLEIEINKLRSENEKEIQKLKQEHAGDINKLIQDKADEIQKLKQEHAGVINKLNQVHPAEVERLNQVHSGEIKKLNQEHVDKNNKLNQEHEGEIEKLTQEKNDKDKEIEKLTQEKNEKDKDIVRLNQEKEQLGIDKDKEIERLTREKNDKDKEIERLTQEKEQLGIDKDKEIERLTREKNDKDKEIERLTQEKEKSGTGKEELIKDKENQIINLTAELKLYKEIDKLDNTEACGDQLVSTTSRVFPNNAINFKTISERGYNKSSEVYLTQCLKGVINDEPDYANKALIINLKSKNNYPIIDFVSLRIHGHIGGVSESAGYRINYANNDYSTVILKSPRSSMITLSEALKHPIDIHFSDNPKLSSESKLLRVSFTQLDQQRTNRFISTDSSDKYIIKYTKYYSQPNSDYSEFDLCIYGKTNTNHLNKYCFEKLKINNKES